jgi:hypothetical protein
MKTITTLLTGIALLMPAMAEPLKSAKITTAVNDVRVYRGSSTGAAAAVGESIAGSDDLHTGRRSRAELTFSDQSISRIGSNSIFSFRSGSRDMEIKQGSFLLQVPKDAGGATIRTATVTAAITGTTTMMEYNPGKWIKFITLEGKAKLKMNEGGETIDVGPGQMVFMRTDAKNIPKPIMINIKKLMETSRLTGKDFKELPKQAKELVEQTIEKQNEARDQGEVAPAGVIVDGPTIKKESGRDPNPSTAPESNNYFYQNQ